MLIPVVFEQGDLIQIMINDCKVILERLLLLETVVSQEASSGRRVDQLGRNIYNLHSLLILYLEQLFLLFLTAQSKRCSGLLHLIRVIQVKAIVLLDIELKIDLVVFFIDFIVGERVRIILIHRQEALMVQLKLIFAMGWGRTIFNGRVLTRMPEKTRNILIILFRSNPLNKREIFLHLLVNRCAEVRWTSIS